MWKGIAGFALFGLYADFSFKISSLILILSGRLICEAANTRVHTVHTFQKVDLIGIVKFLAYTNTNYYMSNTFSSRADEDFSVMRKVCSSTLNECSIYW